MPIIFSSLIDPTHPIFGPWLGQTSAHDRGIGGSISEGQTAFDPNFNVLASTAD
jgi:hypothetical protein